MYPRLLTTPYFTLHTFGVILALAYLLALWWLLRGGRHAGEDPDRLISLGLWCIVGAILGAKVLMILRSFPEYLADPSELWSLSTLQSAGDFYGGFIGALVAAAFFFRKHRDMSVWSTSDLCAPAIALGQAVGRIGCFMAGDDYGKPTSLPWAVTFRDPDAAQIGGAPLGVPLHPVQIYESLTCFAFFLFLVWRSRRKRFEGEIILSYTFLYGLARFLIEYLRGDADRGFLFGGALSTSQFIAAIVVPLSAVLYVARNRRPGALQRSDAQAVTRNACHS